MLGRFQVRKLCSRVAGILERGGEFGCDNTYLRDLRFGVYKTFWISWHWNLYANFFGGTEELRLHVHPENMDVAVLKGLQEASLKAGWFGGL